MDKVQKKRLKVLPKVIGKVNETEWYAIIPTFKREAVVFSSHV